MQDKTNTQIIMDVKTCTEEVLKWSQIEEHILRQRAKINWLRLRDGNNRYSYAHVKAKNMHNGIRRLYKKDGILLANKEDIENEILWLYGNLMGKANDNMEGINIIVMREGHQLSNEQRWMLEAPVTEIGIEKALKDIGDLKAHGVDDFGPKFLKSI